jgi:hypothetical protein
MWARQLRVRCRKLRRVSQWRGVADRDLQLRHRLVSALQRDQHASGPHHRSQRAAAVAHLAVQVAGLRGVVVAARQLAGRLRGRHQALGGRRPLGGGIGHGQRLLEVRDHLAVGLEGGGAVRRGLERYPRLGGQRIGFGALARCPEGGQVVVGQHAGQLVLAERLQVAGGS